MQIFFTFLTLFRKIDFYLVLDDSAYNIFTIMWNLSPALIIKCLKRVRFLLLKTLITSNLTPYTT